MPTDRGEPAGTLPVEIGKELERVSVRTACALWDFISGDCFGMTPDPWVCWDESSGEGCEAEPHTCTDCTERLSAHLKPILAEVAEAAYVAGQAARWLPIETAPTNTSVLIFVPNWDHYGPAIYRAILVDMGTGRHWHTTGWAVGRDLEYPNVQPTHWMPLPAPPASSPRPSGEDR